MSSKNQLKYFDDNGSGILPKIVAKKWKKNSDRRSYSHRKYVLKNDYIKDRRIRRTCSGRKQKTAGYVLLTGSPYRDAE